MRYSQKTAQEHEIILNMSAHAEIKNFVQQTLGCTCPEEVFKKIEYQDESSEIWQKKICVGDRLLIYIVTPEKVSGIEDIINTGLKLGVEERNQKGLNRFRLVLVIANPDEVRSLAEKTFESSEDADEKTHLHLVTSGDIENL